MARLGFYILVIGLVFAATVPARAAQATGGDLFVDAATIGKRVPARDREICLLCNLPISASDRAYLVRGQRAAVHEGACDGKLRANPAALLALLEPRGAFLGAWASASLSHLWFIGGLYVLLGLAFGALCAHHALHKGCCPITWFFLGFFFNAFAYLALLTRARHDVLAPGGVPSGLAKVNTTHAPVSCANCGSHNHPAAGQCTACGSRLAPLVVSEVLRAASKEA